jgi:lipopolysaccharide transport system ATP-binding protein
MGEVAIKFENISKQYRLGLVSTRTVSHDLKRWWAINVKGKEDPYLKIGETNDRTTKGKSEYVWALRDIDFEVNQGDVVGIIGKNGAGKSTLLKILSKLTTPTTGTIYANGRVASLLEVGTGFHPELTGRENVYMNGAILGMSKKEIDSKFDEIIDFSGVERYIDTPVKRYSSGMMVRLGFAVAAHLDPEILVVDEVLAVGDAEFQKKAIGKMQDVSRGQGRTVLFVSHNMASINQLCNKGVLIKNGTVNFTGSIDQTIERYLYSDSQKGIVLNNRTDRYGDQSLFFTDIVTYDSKNNIVESVFTGDSIKIKIEFITKKNCKISEINLRLSIRDSYQQDIAVFNSNEFPTNYSMDTDATCCFIEIPKLLLKGGNYNFSLLAYYKDKLKNQDVMSDYIENVLTLTVIPSDLWNIGKVIHTYPQAIIEGRFYN